MIRSLNTAEKAMQIIQVKIDALANNLANADSTGFKQVLTRVTEKAAGQNGQTPGLAATSTSGTSAHSLRLNLMPSLDSRPGAITETGRQTDLALMGKGFFAIDTEAGERYTRNGSFMLNENRQLTTPDGLLVQGQGGPLTIEGQEFSVENDGSVVADGNVVGMLKIVDFSDPSRLEHQGANLLVAPSDLSPTAVPQTEIRVAQGNLEGSNVNPIDTLVAMIEAQRAFEIQSKIMTTQDDMLNKSVNNLPRATG